MQQQTGWLSSALPKLAPVFAATEAKPVKWLLCAFVLAPGEIASPAQMCPLQRVPGIGDKWTAEVAQPSRTAALRLSKRMAQWACGDAASEKGHISVWKGKLAAGRAKFIAQLTGGAIEIAQLQGEVFFSVLPALDEAAFAAILAPAKPKRAPKPKAKAAKAVEAPQEAVTEAEAPKAADSAPEA